MRNKPLKTSEENNSNLTRHCLIAYGHRS